MIKLLTATAKKYFEDSQETGKQIDEILFPTEDTSTSTTVSVDAYTGKGLFAARSIKNGQPSAVRQYKPGSGYEYAPPLTKEKTPIDEQLDDAVIAGLEANAPQVQHMMEVIRQIIDGPQGHVAAMRMARQKAAVDVYREGVFRSFGEDGQIDEYDFQRKAALDGVYDFTAVGANFDEAIRLMYANLVEEGIPKNNLAVICGTDFLTEFESDLGVIEKRKANSGALLTEQNIVPPLLEGVDGLFVVGKYRVDGMAPPILILSYDPQWPYQATETGSQEAFVPADEALMFNVGGMAWRFNRGVAVLDNAGRKQRVAGEMVIDSFNEPDPLVEWIRSNARFFYARGNINHTARITGTFV